MLFADSGATFLCIELVVGGDMESGLEVEDLESHGHLRKLCPHEGRETAGWN